MKALTIFGIVVLIGLWLPAVGAAHRRAMETVCKNNLKQINLAVAQMDKVTQSNAARAEESAAAAEELNAQALSMTQSVDQLMALAGGSRQEPKAAKVEATTENKKGFAPSLVVNNSKRHHGNGSRSMAMAGARNGDIPMDGDFKDF